MNGTAYFRPKSLSMTFHRPEPPHLIVNLLQERTHLLTTGSRYLMSLKTLLRSRSKRNWVRHG